MQPEFLANVVNEERFQSLTNELRCLVCQNQTIAESNADLAVDLKNLVAKQISEGKTDKEILQYMEDRYGEFVLYNPPATIENSILWLGPFIVLVIAVFFLFGSLKRQSNSKD
tara:strand:+ start:114 stop:452 length:339 start_codon:yes stop_codon:yes gene_type:complete